MELYLIDAWKNCRPACRANMSSVSRSRAASCERHKSCTDTETVISNESLDVSLGRLTTILFQQQRALWTVERRLNLKAANPTALGWRVVRAICTASSRVDGRNLQHSERCANYGVTCACMHTGHLEDSLQQYSNQVRWLQHN